MNRRGYLFATAARPGGTSSHRAARRAAALGRSLSREHATAGSTYAAAAPDGFDSPLTAPT